MPIGFGIHTPARADVLLLLESARWPYAKIVQTCGSVPFILAEPAQKRDRALRQNSQATRKHKGALQPFWRLRPPIPTGRNASLRSWLAVDETRIKRGTIDAPTHRQAMAWGTEFIVPMG